jgi:hypothetical protein
MELLNPLSKADYPSYNVTYTGTAGNTSTWPPGAQGVVVWSDQACYIEVGVGAVATTASTPIPPFTPIPFVLTVNTSGAPWRVSAFRCPQVVRCIANRLIGTDKWALAARFVTVSL